MKSDSKNRYGSGHGSQVSKDLANVTGRIRQDFASKEAAYRVVDSGHSRNLQAAENSLSSAVGSAAVANSDIEKSQNRMARQLDMLDQTIQDTIAMETDYTMQSLGKTFKELNAAMQSESKRLDGAFEEDSQTATTDWQNTISDLEKTWEAKETPLRKRIVTEDRFWLLFILIFNDFLMFPHFEGAMFLH